MYFEDLKQYFPANLALSGIFKICQDLFGLRFEAVTDAEVWNSDVQFFPVLDINSGELMGYFYLDIYSREGNYAHTCVAVLQNGLSTARTKLQVVHLVGTGGKACAAGERGFPFRPVPSEKIRIIL